MKWRHPYHCSEMLVHLTEMSRFVSEVANVSPDSLASPLWEPAPAHKGGVHVSALLKDPKTYEHIVPEAVTTGAGF